MQQFFLKIWSQSRILWSKSTQNGHFENCNH